MPEWSKKDERKYERIKESAIKRGETVKRAKEIAARTVNKERREEGRTPAKKTKGTGKPGEKLETKLRMNFIILLRKGILRGEVT
jgi:plasmid stabilization system protein ParE